MIYKGKKINKTISDIIDNNLIPIGNGDFAASPIAKSYNIDGEIVVKAGDKYIVSSQDGRIYILDKDEVDAKIASAESISVIPVSVIPLNTAPGPIGTVYSVKVDVGNNWRSIAKSINVPEVDDKSDVDVMDEVLEYYSSRIGAPSIAEVAVEIDDMITKNVVKVNDPLSIASRMNSGVFIPFQSPQVEAETLTFSRKIVALFDLNDGGDDESAETD